MLRMCSMASSTHQRSRLTTGCVPPGRQLGAGHRKADCWITAVCKENAYDSNEDPKKEQGENKGYVQRFVMQVTTATSNN